jgi:hypothetical protein
MAEIIKIKVFTNALKMVKSIFFAVATHTENCAAVATQHPHFASQTKTIFCNKALTFHRSVAIKPCQ